MKQCVMLFFVIFNGIAIGQPVQQLIQAPGEAGNSNARKSHNISWFANTPRCVQLRQALIDALDSCMIWGLDKDDYAYKNIIQLAAAPPTDSVQLRNAERLFNDAAIRLAHDIRAGGNISKLVHLDQQAIGEAENEKKVIARQLSEVDSVNALKEFFSKQFLCEGECMAVQQQLRLWKDSANSIRKRQLIPAFNLWRWIRHFGLSGYIVVNIPAASLHYYRQDTLFLDMKVVLGKKSTPTPRFVASCNEITFYPYWNVPNKIAVTELLPLFKTAPGLASLLDMEIISKGSGKLLDAKKIQWNNYSRNNFPFLVRQRTGCDNALGLVRFNLTDPYNVYMHDTNLKKAFLSATRYFSHGCIRLEKPVELAKALLGDRFDWTMLNTCLQGQPPVKVQLPEPVRVFVIYSLADMSKPDTIAPWKDVYHLY